MTDTAAKISELTERLRSLIEPMVADVGAILFDLVVRPLGRDVHIAIVIDNEGGWAPGHGVTVEQTSSVARQLNYALEIESILPADWELEVSSPGIERTLTRVEHFEMHVGQQVRAVIAGDDDRSNVVEGELLGISDEQVVRVKTRAGLVVDAPLSRIRKCRTLFDFSIYNAAPAKPKPGKKAGRPKVAETGRSSTPASAGTLPSDSAPQGGAVQTRSRDGGEGRQ